MLLYIKIKFWIIRTGRNFLPRLARLRVTENDLFASETAQMGAAEDLWLAFPGSVS
jgi:hypothetical protein